MNNFWVFMTSSVPILEPELLVLRGAPHKWRVKEMGKNRFPLSISPLQGLNSFTLSAISESLLWTSPLMLPSG